MKAVFVVAVLMAVLMAAATAAAQGNYNGVDNYEAPAPSTKGNGVEQIALVTPALLAVIAAIVA